MGGSAMPKSRNLPMTTREPMSDAKAREFLLPSSSWGSHQHQYRHSSYREEPWALGYIAYIGYHCTKIQKTGVSRSDWSPSGEGLGVEFWLVLISQAWFEFPGLAKGSDWFAGDGVRSGDFQRLFSLNLTKWSSFDSSAKTETRLSNFTLKWGLFWGRWWDFCQPCSPPFLSRWNMLPQRNSVQKHYFSYLAQHLVLLLAKV